ncbi:EH signature domain-containing protein [Luteitalea sp.]|uniref:EH signature domain-containing protein n=1 Tax=Luteitalea sp. TaxID=2004800 RepID=UPI0025C2AD24|nr:EH signature domain-containing protein [Luteitalea sp.]
MSLRQACQSAELRPRPVEVQWPKLSGMATTISTQWADRPERKPPTFQLDPIVQRVREAWRANKGLDGLTQREVRWLPHAVFHPEAYRDQWLARDSDLMTSVLTRVRERPRGIRSLLRNVIRLWPSELPVLGRIESVLANDLLSATSPRLKEWSERVRKYSLLSTAGPRRFADLLGAHPDQRERLLKDAGLVGELAQAGFLAEAHRHLVSDLSGKMRQARYGTLESDLQVLAPQGKLVFKSDGPLLAEALLGPFVDIAPPSEVQERVRAFLLTHLQDPRLTQTGWASVSADARRVMMRWLVSSTLEDFFALIARWAEQQEHWRYRKAFWSAYLKKGAISGAWVVLGANAVGDAQRRWRDAAPSYGTLIGANNHSVLLLEIGDLTIAEFSHNGTCRVWSRTDRRRPHLYDREYTKSELQVLASHEQRHHGNVQYTWQRQLAEVIREATGISVLLSDYRVR